MKRVGLVGESPNDTRAIRILLEKEFAGKCEFFVMLGKIKGGELDEIKPGSTLIKKIRIEYEIQRPDFVVIIRDLDALEKDLISRRRRLESYARVRRTLDGKMVRLLSIYEIEALLLADTAPINEKYKISMVYDTDPMLQPEPKEYIQQFCSYRESDCPELFARLNFEKLLNVRFFRKFVTEFNKQLATA